MPGFLFTGVGPNPGWTAYLVQRKEDPAWTKNFRTAIKPIHFLTITQLRV